MSNLRILVTGSRDLRDWNLVRSALLDALGTYTSIGPPVLVHGGQMSRDKATGECYGADYIADQVWRQLANERPGWLQKPEVHPADWSHCGPECDAENPEKCRRTKRGGVETYCSRAGHRRNGEMVNLGSTVCLAFPLASSTGTKDCMRKARAAGIPVKTCQYVGAP